MNQIEHSILTRCLNVIYGELLTDRSDIALESIERVIALVRYMEDREDPRSTLGEELDAVREVFQIYCGEQGAAELEIGCSGLDPQLPVWRTTVVYEICLHGMELLHSGICLQSLLLAQRQEHLTYVFSDTSGATYGGTIYGKRLQPNAGP